MQKSENIAELAAALCKAQAEIKASTLDGKNPHFHSEYSTLTAIWDACREALTANGLSVVQTNDDEDADTVVLETTLLHSSGQWITGRLKMKSAKADPQGIGSATTYARRYALAAMVGVAPEDDDAEAATNRQKAGTTASKKSETPKTDDDIKRAYIAKIEKLYKEEQSLGGKPPNPTKALERMSISELEELGKEAKARLNKLADEKAVGR